MNPGNAFENIREFIQDAINQVNQFNEDHEFNQDNEGEGEDFDIAITERLGLGFEQRINLWNMLNGNQKQILYELMLTLPDTNDGVRQYAADDKIQDFKGIFEWPQDQNPIVIGPAAPVEVNANPIQQIQGGNQQADQAMEVEEGNFGGGGRRRNRNRKTKRKSNKKSKSRKSGKGKKRTQKRKTLKRKTRRS